MNDMSINRIALVYLRDEKYADFDPMQLAQHINTEHNNAYDENALRQEIELILDLASGRW